VVGGDNAFQRPVAELLSDTTPLKKQSDLLFIPVFFLCGQFILFHVAFTHVTFAIHCVSKGKIPKRFR